MSLPRINSRTPLQQDDDFSMSFSSAFLHPRKHKYRSTFLALLFLIFLSTYFFFTFGPTLAPSISQQHNDFPADHLALALESLRNSRLADASAGSHGITVKGKGRHRTQVRLDSAQELAAISSFLASLPQNVLPHSVDPSTPLDPQLVLDFDTRGPRASDEVRAMVEEVWSRNPVFVYSKLYSPTSRELKSILANLYLKPAPTIIDIDVRDDAAVLKPILARLTSSTELPILLVNGKPVGSIEDIRELVKSGELQQMIGAAGAVINGAKAKKHRK
ncbi:putative expressed protein [Laccaria bicolor S238N-H82]|uniref:Hypothetical expressed protein n=1 Tax=Laccaria bicolor (strain S238N-H82 / ATCC MYA-4686) TaxID=486041 RepID=B0D129_LACBS|nr:putative expressed protein [Laccaria bicolor S238N-H82]EDR11929.1 hypothetical expressed protein [Laccaria bicolor S238N-H82]|eukprot:XP_001877826.1 hypothetical expressed protein [Laccaria bicolor S238N-H82]